MDKEKTLFEEWRIHLSSKGKSMMGEDFIKGMEIMFDFIEKKMKELEKPCDFCGRK